MEFIPDASLHSSRRYRASSPFLLPSPAQTHVDSILGFWQTLINYRCPCALLFSIQISSTLASTPSSSSSSSWWRRNRVPTRVLKGINLPPTPRPGAAASCPSSTYILQEYRQFIRSWTIYPTSSSHADMYVCMYTKVNVKVEQQRSRLRAELRGAIWKEVGTQQRRFEFRNFGWDVSKLQQARKNTSPAMND